MKTEDTEAFRRRRAKPSKIKARYSRPTCKTARTTVHHDNGRKYCSTETVLLTFPFFQTNIVSQMWPSGGKGEGEISENCNNKKHYRESA